MEAKNKEIEDLKEEIAKLKKQNQHYLDMLVSLQRDEEALLRVLKAENREEGFELGMVREIMYIKDREKNDVTPRTMNEIRDLVKRIMEFSYKELKALEINRHEDDKIYAIRVVAFNKLRNYLSYRISEGARLGTHDLVTGLPSV